MVGTNTIHTIHTSRFRLLSMLTRFVSRILHKHTHIKRERERERGLYIYQLNYKSEKSSGRKYESYKNIF
jgi:hypothetical protein